MSLSPDRFQPLRTVFGGDTAPGAVGDLLAAHDALALECNALRDDAAKWQIINQFFDDEEIYDAVFGALQIIAYKCQVPIVDVEYESIDDLFAAIFANTEPIDPSTAKATDTE